MHLGSVAFYYIISYILLSLLFWLGMCRVSSQAFSDYQEGVPSREAILAFTHLSYLTMPPFPSSNDLSTN
jgi:hypothetical protein